MLFCFFFSSRRRHTRWNCDWSSDVCSSDLGGFQTNVIDAVVYNHEEDSYTLIIAGNPEWQRAPKRLLLLQDKVNSRSEERRVGKRVDLGGGRISNKKRRRE